MRIDQVSPEIFQEYRELIDGEKVDERLIQKFMERNTEFIPVFPQLLRHGI